MYILIVARGYPSEKYKMNGIFEFDQAKALANSGRKIVYAAIDMRSIRRKRKWGYESLLKDGVQIEVINFPCGKIPKFMQDELRLLAFKKLYKRIENKYGKPIIIHAHFLNYGYIIARLFKNNQIPLMLTEHFSVMNQKNISRYQNKLGKYTYNRMNKVITVSKTLAKSLIEKFDVNSVVIPNIVDTACFKYEQTYKNNDIFKFISTGGLIPRKGMNLLINAFMKAFKGVNNVSLYIYGEGPEYNNLKKMIKDYGLNEQIFLMGLVDREVIADKMYDCDCFVLASKLETFGVVYIEAMAMGLPVIATQCGGPEHFVTEEQGIIIPVDDVIALTNAMKNMYLNINRYDKKNISQYTIKRFCSLTITNQLNDIYDKLLL